MFCCVLSFVVGISMTLFSVGFSIAGDRTCIIGMVSIESGLKLDPKPATASTGYLILLESVLS